MEYGVILLCLFCTVCEIGENNRIRRNLEKHFDDYGHVPQEYRPSNFGMILMLITLIIYSILKLIELFAKGA